MNIKAQLFYKSTAKITNQKKNPNQQPSFCSRKMRLQSQQVVFTYFCKVGYPFTGGIWYVVLIHFCTIVEF